MKKLKYLVLLLLLFPITVCAKTPNKEETIKVIESIENVQVDEGIIIYSAEYDEDKIILNINDNGTNKQIPISCTFDDESLTFKGGKYLVKDDVEVIESNNYAFYLYSILENISNIPYNIDSYYNNDNVIKKVKEFKANEKTYIESSNTFGLSLSREQGYIRVYYNYYFTGDYPVMIKEEITDEFKNPDTGNYTIYITIMLVIVAGLAIYTYVMPVKE